MNSVSKALGIAGLALLLALPLAAFAPAHAVTNVNLAKLPNCSTETGLFYDSTNSVVWQPCYDTGILYKEDFSTNPATLTRYDISATMGTFNEIAVWGDSSHLYNIGRGGGGAFAGVAESSLSSPATLTTPVSGLSADVYYPTELNSMLYVPYDAGVAALNTGTNAVTQITTGLSGQLFQCANNGTYIFCSSLGGAVYKIDPATDGVSTVISGLPQLYGIAADSSYVYVAEHGGSQVVKVSISTDSVVATSSLPAGSTPYGVALYGSYIITDSDSGTLSTRNIFVLNAADLSTANTVSCPVSEAGQCRPLFILITDTNGNAYVGFQGSAGAAQVQLSSWEPSSSSSSSGSGGQNGGVSVSPDYFATPTLTGGCSRAQVMDLSGAPVTCSGYLWMGAGLGSSIRSMNLTVWDNAGDASYSENVTFSGIQSSCSFLGGVCIDYRTFSFTVTPFRTAMPWANPTIVTLHAWANPAQETIPGPFTENIFIWT